MEQKVNHTIPALKQKFFSLIQENRYSEQYRYYMRLRFASLEAYMSRNSCHNYSPEIGEQFISDFIKNRDIEKSTRQALETFINKVNDAFCGCSFMARHSKNTSTQPSGFEKALDGYASRCMRNGIF